MKKISILLALIFVLVSCGKVVEESEKTAALGTEILTTTSDVVVEEGTVETPVVAAAGGSYQDYSEEAVKASTGNNVLFFHATWCGSCVTADTNLKAEAIPEGLNVFKLDFDTSTELRKKYGVTTKHTFVLLDENMEKVKMAQGTVFNSADIVKELLGDSMMKKDDTAMEEKTMEKEEIMVKEEELPEAPVVAAGSYSDYSEAAVKAAAGSKVLFFAATWCPSCVSADKNMKAETIPEGLNVFKVDYDSNTQLRKKYGVTSQHTFVLVDDNMEKVKLAVGGRNSADIVNTLLN